MLSIASSVSVCLSVCLFVCLLFLSIRSHISQTIGENFTKFSVAVILWPWLGPLTKTQSLCNAGFVDDVMERIGQNQRRSVCLAPFARWRHRGQSLPSSTASCCNSSVLTPTRRTQSCHIFGFRNHSLLCQVVFRTPATTFRPFSVPLFFLLLHSPHASLPSLAGCSFHRWCIRALGHHSAVGISRRDVQCIDAMAAAAAAASPIALSSDASKRWNRRRTPMELGRVSWKITDSTSYQHYESELVIRVVRQSWNRVSRSRVTELTILPGRVGSGRGSVCQTRTLLRFWF